MQLHSHNQDAKPTRAPHFLSFTIFFPFQSFLFHPMSHEAQEECVTINFDASNPRRVSVLGIQILGGLQVLVLPCYIDELHKSFKKPQNQGQKMKTPWQLDFQT